MKTHLFKAGPVAAFVNVIEEDDDLVYEDERMVGQWWVTDLRTTQLRSWRAKECMNELFKSAKAAGVKFVALHPWARDGIDQESLIRFYESCGFVDEYYAYVASV